jgi:hypothetical protein
VKICKVEATSADYIAWLHREFCIRLPEEMLWVENPDTGKPHTD